MKTNRYIISAGMILGGVLLGSLTACQDSYDAPELVVPQATLTANTTLAEFKAQFADEMAVLTPYKDADTETPYIIKGRVVSSDASGNIYKSLVIQDETTALALSINQSSMYIDYRLGQEVVINATGLWMGQYNNLLQLGALGEYQSSPQITFMPYAEFQAHTEKNGLPDVNFKTINFGDEAPANSPYKVRITLNQLNSIAANSPEYYYIMSQLVEIPEVSFKDAGQVPPVTYSKYQETLDRYVKDADGAELNVRCSGYSSFYNDPLPEGIGSVTGILSRYQDSWQLLLRDTNDCDFSTKGTRQDPFTTVEAIAVENSGRKAWVKGYIIGSVRSGLEDNKVTTINDIIFTAEDAELENNLVIAPTADSRNLNEMMVVSLPANTMIRRYANLLDNPDVLGHLLTVEGNLTEVLGMAGVSGAGSGMSAFTIEGINVGGLDGLGTGSEEDPFKPSYIVKVAEEMTDFWIEGYIVGFVEGKNYENGAYFGGDTKDKNFGGNNFILGDAAATISTDNAVVVNLTGSALRDELDLIQHPELYGKRVKLKGNAGTAFGSLGVIGVTEAMIFE